MRGEHGHRDAPSGVADQRGGLGAPLLREDSPSSDWCVPDKVTYPRFPQGGSRYRSPDPVDHARLSCSLELPVDGQDRKRECGHRAASVVRIGPRPHLVRSSKFSKEAHFDEKLADVVGLYHHPLDWAMALRMDQRSQIQMLDRSQPLLPRKKERAGTMNHDYERSGGATLLAALNVLTEVVVGERPPRRVFRVPASSRPQTSENTSSSSHFG